MTAGSIRRISWRPFSVPLRVPLGASWGTLRSRAGILVTVEGESGERGEGEASPLEGFGGGSLAETIAALEGLASAAIGRPLAAVWAEEGPDAAPGAAARAARCGLETAVGDALGRQRGVPLFALLGSWAGLPPRSQVTFLPVNEVVDARSPEEVARAASTARAAGFPALKLKVGGDPELDARRVAAARAAAPDIELRVDANGAWGVDEAGAFLGAVREERVALCEEPIRGGMEHLGRIAELRRMYGVPIALDESLAGCADVRAAMAAAAVDAVVVKPMRLGLKEAARALRLAVDANLLSIVTTTFDAGWGTMAAAHLAALVPEPAPASGLATLARLENPLVTPAPFPERGRLALPLSGGLGVACDGEALESFATAPEVCVQP